MKRFFFYCPIKLFVIPSYTKFIRKDFWYLWLSEFATTSAKELSRTKLKLQLNFANVTPSYDLLIM
jgi:hypothetical protein